MEAMQVFTHLMTLLTSISDHASRRGYQKGTLPKIDLFYSQLAETISVFDQMTRLLKAYRGNTAEAVRRFFLSNPSFDGSIPSFLELLERVVFDEYELGVFIEGFAAKVHVGSKPEGERPQDGNLWIASTSFVPHDNNPEVYAVAWVFHLGEQLLINHWEKTQNGKIGEPFPKDILLHAFNYILGQHLAPGGDASADPALVQLRECFYQLGWMQRP